MVYIPYFKTKINKKQNISIGAPLSSTHIDIFQFIQIFIFFQYMYRKLIPFNG